jgi:hypothetical protein
MPRIAPLTAADLLDRYAHPPDEHGCRLFKLSRTNKGYGSMRWNGRQRPAHRVSYELAFGPIPAGMMICHHCDVRNCIEPTHLFVGTALDNMRDKIKKGRAVYTPKQDFCLRGHPYAGDNIYTDKNGERSCRECRSITGKQFYRSNRDKISAERKARNAAIKAYWDRHWAAIAAAREAPTSPDA